MKLEKFNYSNGKRGRWFLYGFIMCAVLMVLINLFFSEAKYLNTESIKLAEGKISYKPYDFKIMAMYQENGNGNYEEIETMPTGSYIINEEKSYCTLDNINKDNNAILKTIGSKHTIENISSNDKCYLYFDKVVVSNIQDLINSKTIVRREDFSVRVLIDTTGTIYITEDDYGISYYYAGAVQDNWVKFAGFYWRIIRINGDGTIRMIYQGESANTTGTGTQTTTSAFNSSYNNNMYVGYMYTSGQIHGTGTSSTIKKTLDSWYLDNLSGYASYIATGGGATFCNDRTPYSGSGTGTTNTEYAAYNRLNSNKTPILKCINSSDVFDTSVGLITADEVAYAGGLFEWGNSKFYLYTAQYYWTMTPATYSTSNSALIFNVDSDGNLNNRQYVAWSRGGVRPVINLKADTVFSSGDGTSTNPYIVE